MNPNDVMLVVLKDIPLSWLGFRFIYIVYISWHYIQDVSNVLLPPTCLYFGLPVSPACLSVSQTLKDDLGHKGNTGQLFSGQFMRLGFAVSNNLVWLNSQFFSLSQSYIVYTPPPTPLSAGGGWGWASNQT